MIGKREVQFFTMSARLFMAGLCRAVRVSSFDVETAFGDEVFQRRHIPYSTGTFKTACLLQQLSHVASYEWIMLKQWA